MKQIVNWFSTVLVFFVGVSVYGYSNPIEGGTTERVTNAYQAQLPWYIVGGNSAGNSLIVTDGGRVDNQIGYIGNNTPSSNNTVFVTGAGSSWNSSMELSVGNLGSSNTLTVADGGRVDTAVGYVGNNSDNNAANIDGSGSLLNATTLHVGHLGSDNQLTVSDGGRVDTADGTIGYWIGSDGNTATVQGSNSLWQSTGTINVGDYGSGNQLMIDDGGRVESPIVNLGMQSISSNNTVTVTGNGSVLDAPEIHVGGSAAGAGGTGNRVEVEDGGTVATTDLNLYAGNQFDLNNGGTLAVSTHFNAALAGFNFNSGGTLEVAGELTGMGPKIEDQRTVVMKGSNAVWNKAGSSLYVGRDTSGNSMIATKGAQINSTRGYVGYGSNSSNNTATVSGSNSTWRATRRITVGYQGDDNNLVINKGGQVIVEDLIMADRSISSGNTVVVSGEGSRFTTTGGGGVVVGAGGSNNRIEVTDGAWVDAAGGIGYAILGYYSSSTNNSMLVDDATVQLKQNMYVGLSGSVNHMTITNGGVVRASRATIMGRQETSNGNSAIVTGAGSVLESANQFFVGYEGSENRFMVDDGGRVENRIGYLGYASGANSNSVLVTGADSVWKNNEALYLGGHKSGANWVDGGTGNSLAVEGGGWVQVGDIGTNTIPDHGILGVLSVGGLGGAEMVIANGSYVKSDMGFVGINPAMSGSVTVMGEGSVWSNSVGLFVGEGSDSSVSILDGGRVDSGMGLIGLAGDSSNNLVVVSGAGSEWKIPPSYYTGRSNVVYSDARSRQDIFGSGPRTNSSPFDPFQSGILSSMGGVSSRLDTPSGLSVGYMGSGNSLVISEGGRVESAAGHIGYDAMASENSVLVSGTESVWDASHLNVGYNGSGNSLRVEDGGIVHAQWGSSIGYGEGADGNSVVVSGENSLFSSGWYRELIRVKPPFTDFPSATNFYPIYVGSGVFVSEGNLLLGGNDFGNELVISNGLFAGNGLIMGGALSNNYISVAEGGTIWVPTTNELVVGGPFIGGGGGLVLTNEVIVITNLPPVRLEPILVMASLGELSIGRGGSGNSLLIEKGALVSDYNGIIGETSNAWNNAVSVVGTNSEWRSSGDLYMGGRMSQFYTVTSNGWENSWVDGGRGNSLYVADGGLVSVGRDMHNRNDSTVSVDPGGHISIASNYYQDATSVLRFGVETNAAGAPLNPFVSVGGTAEFEEGATLQYHSNVGLLDFDTFYTNLIVEANQLIIAGITNANAVDLQALNLDGSLVNLMLWEQNQNIYGLVGRKHLADSAGFLSGSQMARIAKEIDDLSLRGNPLAAAHINRLNGMSRVQQAAQMKQRYTQGTPIYRHRQGLLGGQKQVLAQSRAFQSENRSSTEKPEGAAGPHQAGQELSGWIRGYGSWADHEGNSSFSGFDQQVYGTVVGLDKSFGKVLLGAAGGYSRSDLTQDNNDSSDAKTGFGVLYSSFGSVDWFGDLNLSYGRSRIETHSGTALGGEGDFDADHYSVYLGGGKEILLSDGGVQLTPSTALLLGYYDQDGYNDGLMEVDTYDRWSVQSRLGAALAVQKVAGSVVLKPEVRAYWLHEFNADPDQIGYSLGGGRYSFGMQSPDEDILEIGAGLSATFSDRLELVFDVDGQYSDRYESITVSGRAIYEF